MNVENADSINSSFIKKYIYKKEIDWSALTEGMTIPVQYQLIFGSNEGVMIQRGGKKTVHVYFGGNIYDAVIININFNKKYDKIHPTDLLQIRYKKGLKEAVKIAFANSYNYFLKKRELEKQSGSRKHIRLPEGKREYLVLYSTGREDLFYLETILAEDIAEIDSLVRNKSETTIEAELNFDLEDSAATIIKSTRSIKIRRLNRKIADNLKELYSYRCQICGCLIGKQYDSHIIEAHHIDYFVNSLNNDASNQLIVCPNHHRIIHDKNPIWNGQKLEYTYPNGYTEGLVLNYHLAQTRNKQQV